MRLDGALTEAELGGYFALRETFHFVEDDDLATAWRKREQGIREQVDPFVDD
jgi:hypothetical protein